jgi:hypothetical protein
MVTVQCPLCPAEIQEKGINRHDNSIHQNLTCEVINAAESRVPPRWVDCEHCHKHYFRAGIRKQNNKCSSRLGALDKNESENENENDHKNENKDADEHENENEDNEAGLAGQGSDVPPIRAPEPEIVEPLDLGKLISEF